MSIDKDFDYLCKQMDVFFYDSFLIQNTLCIKKKPHKGDRVYSFVPSFNYNITRTSCFLRRPKERIV